MEFNGPIPGQSLTKTPRNAPYERPPEIAEPNDAIIWHMRRLVEPERLDNLLFTLEYGVPVKHVTQSLLTVAVAKGIHNIDVSLVIAPVIHKFIASTAEEAGVSFVHDFENKEMKEADEKRKVLILLEKAMAETPKEEQDAGYEMMGELAEAVPAMDIEQETQGDISPEVEEAASEVEATPQRGLMARG